jgi:sRNA-binding carbon storage regulator CsrA
MLIVERGIDEAVIVDEVIVRVVSVAGREVRLAVASPDGAPRYREVVLQLPSESCDPQSIVSAISIAAPRSAGAMPPRESSAQ